MPRPAAIFLLPLVPLLAAAQTPAANQRPAISNWEVVKMLAPGTEVRVVSNASKSVRGTIESATDSDLVLMKGKGTQSFPRPRIVSVSVKGKEHRLRNTLIGLGVGTVVGGAIGFAAGESGQSYCKAANGCLTLDAAADTAAGGIIGLLSGTFTGLLWPTGGWRPIYAP